MSGVVTAATIASIGLGIGGTVLNAVQGATQAGAQKKALQSQENAQKKAELATISQNRKSEMAQNAANMRTPDIAAIMARAAKSGQNMSSTMLTGAGGVDPNSLQLGRTTLLGA